MVFTRPFLMSCLLLPLSCLACGGGGSKSKTPDSVSQGGDSETAGNSSWSEEKGKAADPNCDDGTCFPCGEGICPQGAYCDLDAEGGAACAWITECPAAPSCSCVTNVIGKACSCTDDAGGPSVSCQ